MASHGSRGIEWALVSGVVHALERTARERSGRRYEELLQLLRDNMDTETKTGRWVDVVWADVTRPMIVGQRPQGFVAISKAGADTKLRGVNRIWQVAAEIRQAMGWRP